MIKLRTAKKKPEQVDDKPFKTVYCLYRVSTAGQVDHDDIPMQKEACREFAMRQNGWIIKKEFYEKGVSGYKVSASDRSEMQNLLTAAQNHEFDILLVFMFDRLGRRQNETSAIVETFNELGVEVWSTKEGQQRFESEADYLLNYMRFWAANGESRKTSMRVKTRLSQLVEQGSFTGGTAPFGYRLVNSGTYNKKGRELKKLEVVEKEAEIVKMVFDKTIKEGYGSFMMAEYLNSMKIKTHNGRPFHSMAITRILRNPIYCGYYVRGESVSPKQPELVIIDEDLYNEAQRIVDGRMHDAAEEDKVPRYTDSESIISGTVFCGHCGKKMCTTTHLDCHFTKSGEKRMGKRKMRYLCVGKAMRKNECDGQSAYVGEKIDAVVMKYLKECFEKIRTTPKDITVERNFKAHINDLKRKSNQLKSDIEAEKKRMRDLTDEIADALTGSGRFTPEALSNALESCKHKIVDKSNELAELEKTLSDQSIELKNLDERFNQFVSWAEEFENVPAQRQRMIVNLLLDGVYVFRGYKIIITMKSTYKQFLSDWIDKAS